MNEEVKHKTEAVLEWNKKRAVATCSCGWVAGVPYVKDGIGSQVALRMAKILARNHRRDAE